MTTRKRSSLVLVGAVVAAGIVSAQHPHPGMTGMHYDPARETTIQGTVDSIQRGQGMMQLLLARVKTAPDKFESVIVGPAWFLEEKKFTLAKGDEISITGAFTPRNAAILARTVKKGEENLILRDGHGMPMWAGHTR